MNGVRAGLDERSRENAKDEEGEGSLQGLRGVEGTNRGMDGSVYAD